MQELQKQQVKGKISYINVRDHYPQLRGNMLLDNSKLGNQFRHSRATIFAKFVEPKHIQTTSIQKHATFCSSAQQPQLTVREHCKLMTI